MKSLPEHPVYAGAHLLPWTAPFVLVFDAYILEFSAAEHYGKAASTPNDDAAVEEYTRGTIQVVQLAGMASPLAETPRAPIRAPGAIDLTSLTEGDLFPDFAALAKPKPGCVDIILHGDSKGFARAPDPRAPRLPFSTVADEIIADPEFTPHC